MYRPESKFTSKAVVNTKWYGTYRDFLFEGETYHNLQINFETYKMKNGRSFCAVQLEYNNNRMGFRVTMYCTEYEIRRCSEKEVQRIMERFDAVKEHYKEKLRNAIQKQLERT